MLIVDLYQSLLLAVSVCADSFAAAASYSARNIKVPLSSAVVISAVSAGVLTISTLAGGLMAPVFSPQLSKTVCFCLLFLMGCVRIFDATLKAWIRRSGTGQLKFTAFQLNFLLQIYADPQRADMDDGGVLSPKEAFFMALALSLDGLAAGFGAGAGGVHIIFTALFALAFGFAAVILGSKVGTTLTRYLHFDISPLGGIMLIVLAFLKLI